MNSTKSPRKWRVLVGGIVGLIGVVVIGAALIFPTVTTPQVPTAVAASASPSVSASPPEVESVEPTPAASATQPASAPPASPSPEPTPTVAAHTESAPVRVRIPSLGVDASTVTLGLDGNELATPEDPDVVGWFTGAHTPGGPGRAVLAGHLTWNGRNTVFALLPEATVGTIVEVDREDGTTAKFEITEVSTFPKDQFPTDAVYASTVEPSLVLITCGGEYSQADHFYDSNVIAFATLLTE